MKSNSSNSSNKNEKQMFKAKNVIKIKIQLTGKGSRPVFTKTDLPVDRKTIKKDEAQKLILFLKKNILKSHSRLGIATKSDGLIFNTSGSQLDLLMMGPQRKKYIKKPKLQTILRHDIDLGTLNIKCYWQELYTIFSP